MNNEPVAYIDPYDLERLPHYDCHIGSQQLKNGIPLYTHPVKELTDEEIEKCCCFLDVRLHHRYEPNAVVKDIEWTVTGIKDFVRAILRKANEK